MRPALWTLVGVGVALLALAGHSLLSDARAARPALPVGFAHADHAAENCVVCHHNFADDSGRGPLCIACHKQDPQLAPLVEWHFHQLCRSCHVERRARGKASGPTRACIQCHVADTRP